MSGDQGKVKFRQPIYRDYSSYQEEASKEDSPCAAVFLLADSEVLFQEENGFPWLNRVKCELPSRDVVDGMERPIKASYVGIMTNNDPQYFRIFLGAMKNMGISPSDCMMIHQDPSKNEKAHLEQSDIIVIGGGDIVEGWKAFSDERYYLGERIKWRYYNGAVLIGLSEGATILGVKGWNNREKDIEKIEPFPTIGIVPLMIGFGDHNLVEDVVGKVRAGAVAMCLSKGGGVIFNRDGSFEPARKPICDFSWYWKDETVHKGIIFPPENDPGILIANEKLRKRGEMVDKQNQNGKPEIINNANEEEEAIRLVMAQSMDDVDLDDGEISNKLSTEDSAKMTEFKEKGNKFFKMGEIHYQKALIMYEKGLKIDPQNLNILLNKSLILLKLNRFDEALTTANLILWISDGKLPKAWYRRGISQMKKKNYQLALDDFEEANVLEPEDKLSQEHKSECSNMLNELYEAHEGIEQSLLQGVEKVDCGLKLVISEKSFSVADLPILESVVDRKYDIIALTINDFPLGTSGARFLVKGLKRGSKIDILSLRNCHIGPDGAELLADALAENDSIAELDLSYNSIRDRGFIRICKYALPSNKFLLKLSLAHNCLTDQHALALGEALVLNNTLVELDLSINRMSYDVIRNISAALTRNEYFQKLNLEANRLESDAVYRLLTSCKNHQSMISVNFKGARISEDNVKDITRQLQYKKCQFVFGKSELEEKWSHLF